jgi:hypothetical protein
VVRGGFAPIQEVRDLVAVEHSAHDVPIAVQGAEQHGRIAETSAAVAREPEDLAGGDDSLDFRVRARDQSDRASGRRFHRERLDLGLERNRLCPVTFHMPQQRGVSKPASSRIAFEDSRFDFDDRNRSDRVPAGLEGVADRGPNGMKRQPSFRRLFEAECQGHLVTDPSERSQQVALLGGDGGETVHPEMRDPEFGLCAGLVRPKPVDGRVQDCFGVAETMHFKPLEIPFLKKCEVGEFIGQRIPPLEPGA